MKTTVDIQIVSDLHLETPLARPQYESFELSIKAPYLALLGDIGKVNQPGLFTFLKNQLSRYQVVFYLLGNHEAYREKHEYSSYSKARELVRSFESEVNSAHPERESGYGQFVFLERTRFDVPDSLITILGCTLFSHITPEQEESVALKVSDFSPFGSGSGHIDDWDVHDHNSAHSEDLTWLNKTVQQIEQEAPTRELVILTHHSPTKLIHANDPRHLEDRSQVNSAFVTDLSREICWTSPSVKLWAFGHTHYNCDFVTDRSDDRENNNPRLIRILTNQKGYFRTEESPGFDEHKVVMLGADLSQYTPLQSDPDFAGSGKNSDRSSRKEESASGGFLHQLRVFWCFD